MGKLDNPLNLEEKTNSSDANDINLALGVVEETKNQFDGISRIDINNKPSPEYIIAFLTECDPDLLDYYRKGHIHEKHISFEEFLSKQCWQLGKSKIAELEVKEDTPPDNYFSMEGLNHKGETITYDIFCEKGDIDAFCREKGYTDFKFLGWGFDLSLKK